jgi:glycosyltransferase involved in cell wall biosynthesis
MPSVLDVCNELLSYSPPIEIVLVDDGSTDLTTQLMQRFASRHPENVLYARNETSIGIAACFTRIANLSSGSLILLVPGDHTYDYGAIERVLNTSNAVATEDHAVLGLRANGTRSWFREFAAGIVRNSLFWIRPTAFPLPNYGLILAPKLLTEEVGSEVRSYGGSTAQLGAILMDRVPITTVDIYQVVGSGSRSAPITWQRIGDIASAHVWLVKRSLRSHKRRLR